MEKESYVFPYANENFKNPRTNFSSPALENIKKYKKADCFCSLQRIDILPIY